MQLGAEQRRPLTASRAVALRAQLAEFTFVTDEGEVHDAEIHALAISECIRETYFLTEVTARFIGASPAGCR